MKSRLYILFAFLNIAMVACEHGSVDVDTAANIVVKSKNGQNLLNSTTPGYLDPKNIKIFCLKVGVKEEVFSLGDIPRPFEVVRFPANGEYYITVQMSTYSEATTYIQWNNTDEDTLKCTVYRHKGSISVDNISWNDVLKFKNNDPYRKEIWGTVPIGRFFEVQK